MFQFVPVPESVADHVRSELADPFGNRALRPIVVDEESSFPCRVCLEDARIGEQVLLFSYRPLDRPAPHQTLGPIYVHAERCAPFRPSARLPAVLGRRLVAFRAYDSDAGELIDCDVLEGAALVARLPAVLANPRVARIHVHLARPGCFACAIERTGR